MSLKRDLLAMINRDVSLDTTVDIDVDTDLLLTDLVDSLGVVEIVAWLEDRLDVRIDPVDVVLENFQTVGRMVAFSERPTSTNGSGP